MRSGMLFFVEKLGAMKSECDDICRKCILPASGTFLCKPPEAFSEYPEMANAPVHRMNGWHDSKPEKNPGQPKE